jgi:hypothetical protein
MILIMAILLVVAILGIPELKHMIVRGKLTGAANEVAAHLTLGRMEAIKRGRPVVMVPDFDSIALSAFVDNNDNQTLDPGEVVLISPRIPEAVGQGAVYFVGPDGAIGTAAAPAQSIWGWTIPPGETLPVAVFQPDGSIRDEGGIRIGDSQEFRRNIFEVRVTPQATARIEMRKYAWDGAGGPPDFYPAGAGLWEWY